MKKHAAARTAASTTGTVLSRGLAVLGAVALLLVVAVVALIASWDHEVDESAQQWAGRAGASVHRTVVSLRSSYPAGSPLSDESRLRSALGEIEGVRVLRSQTRPDGSVELELSLVERQSLNAFVGRDFVACARITTEPVRDAPEGRPRGAVTTTDLPCPPAAQFGDGLSADSVAPDDAVTAAVPERTDLVPFTPAP